MTGRDTGKTWDTRQAGNHDRQGHGEDMGHRTSRES